MTDLDPKGLEAACASFANSASARGETSARIPGADDMATAIRVYLSNAPGPVVTEEAVNAALNVWYRGKDWREYNSKLLEEVRRDMRAALTAAATYMTPVPAVTLGAAEAALRADMAAHGVDPDAAMNLLERCVDDAVAEAVAPVPAETAAAPPPATLPAEPDLIAEVRALTARAEAAEAERDALLALVDEMIASHFPSATEHSVRPDTWAAIQRHRARTTHAVFSAVFSAACAAAAPHMSPVPAEAAGADDMAPAAPPPATPSAEPDTFLSADDPDITGDDPVDVFRCFDAAHGDIVEVWTAKRMPTVYVTVLPPAPGADTDDERVFVGSSPAEVEAWLRDRRAEDAAAPPVTGEG